MGHCSLLVQADGGAVQKPAMHTSLPEHPVQRPDAGLQEQGVPLTSGLTHLPAMHRSGAVHWASL